MITLRLLDGRRGWRLHFAGLRGTQEHREYDDNDTLPDAKP
jgi:hypothetical protein